MIDNIIQNELINSYKLSRNEVHVIYGFVIATLNNIQYKHILNSPDNKSLFYYPDDKSLFYYSMKICHIILPNSILYKEFNDILAKSDVSLIFNSEKNLTIFLLKKDTFFNYLQNNDYTALGL